MKNAYISVCLVIFSTILCALVFLSWGCSSYAQPGETEAQGRIRHQRVLRINQQQLMSDIDRAMLLDKPSKLTDKRTP